MSQGGACRRFVGSAVALASVLTIEGALGTADAQQKSIRWATSDSGTYGYSVASAMVSLLGEALGSGYRVTVNPYPSTTAAMKAAMDGEAEIAYTADVGMSEAYAGGGGFQDYEPARGRLVHAWYAYPMESFMAAPATIADQLWCWSDLSGKPVFYTAQGFMNWLNWRRIYDALDYEFNHVEIDVATNADALEAGTIVGSAAYTTAGRSLAAYWQETESRTDITLINPCPDEVEKLQAAGLSTAKVDPSIAFSQDVGVDRVVGVPILFGYNVRPDMPEDVVYAMLTAFYEKRFELAEIDPGFTPLASSFVEMQVNGINANPDIPVHSGLADFLKEHDAWNDAWAVADGPQSP